MPNFATRRVRLFRPHFFHTALLAGLLAACTAGTGPTAVPTVSPPPTGSPAPTASPSPTPSPTLNPEQIQHPTGPAEVVLRMEQGGGFVPMEFFATQAPQFTLYGDGTVVFRPVEDAARFGVTEGLPRFLTGKMTEEGVQALLLYALDTGRLANAKDSYNESGCADCPTTTFVLDAAGLEKVVSVYALGMEVQPGPESADRAGFAQLADLLTNFLGEAESGTVDELSLYDPELYRVTLYEAMGEPGSEPIEWPWDDVTVDDFPKGDEPGASKILDREHVAALADVPNGGIMSLWMTDPDGNLYTVAIRPLLPDEIAGVEL